MAGEALGTPRSENDIVSLGIKNGIEMAILVRTAKTLGKIILKPDSASGVSRALHGSSEPQAPAFQRKYCAALKLGRS
jgi:hypothetical protein